MLTPEKLKEIEERCNKATPGPWAWEIDRNDNFDGNNPYELWATHAMSLGINSPVAVGIGVVQEPFKRVNEEVFMDYWFEAVEWFR